jgi:ribosomal protein S6
MTEEAVATAAPEEAKLARVYEVGYHIVPTVAEDSLEKVTGDIRAAIETAAGGSVNFLAEGAPALTRLSYEMETLEGDKSVEYDRGYFGWIKYEASPESVEALDAALKANPSVMRHLIFQTVREETRARLKLPTLREVKRTDTLRAAPRRAPEQSVPVSEADLDKALSDLTTD